MLNGHQPNGLIGGTFFIDNMVSLFGLACGILCFSIAMLMLVWGVHDSIYGCHVIGIRGGIDTSDCTVIFIIGGTDLVYVGGE